ncbi:MAG: uroporphyrinogen decarboxylase [Deltaproteobacteria bacterium]|nr:uroporphyrinogen decarboxylase [Deltaproteobacteria bacterium]
MNSLERTVMAIEGKEADRVPVCPLMLGVARNVYGCRYDEFSKEGELFAKSCIAAQELIGFDVHVLLWDLTLEAHDFGQDTQFLENDTTRPNYDNPMITGPDKYNVVKPIEPCVTKGPGGMSRMAEYVKALDIMMNEVGKDTAVVAFVFGTLGLLGMMRGAEKLFFDCVKNFDAQMEAQLVIQDVLLDYIPKVTATGVHGVCLDTLYASGGIMSKKLWNKVEAPTAKKLADKIREKTTVWVHNCGNNVYFDAQIDAMDPIGISYAYVSDDCETHEEMKQKYGDKITLFGYVHPAERLFLGTKQELLDEVKVECDQLKAGGRYILAPGCEFPPNGNLNMAVTMMEGAELYGKY